MHMKQVSIKLYPRVERTVEADTASHELYAIFPPVNAPGLGGGGRGDGFAGLAEQVVGSSFEKKRKTDCAGSDLKA